MKNIQHSRLLAALILTLWSLPQIFGQSQASDPTCSGGVAGGVMPASAFFNYGNSNKMKNSTRRMRLTIGQPVVGAVTGDDFSGNFGFWTSFVVAPLPPIVRCTQGELLDRIQISWSVNPLGAFPSGGFKIYRDGVFLAAVDKNTRNYNDFNIISGQNYTYTVRGINLYGEGAAGEGLGFQVPNGVATGWVRTINGNAVPNALVSLTPMQGYSTKFAQFDGAFAQADASTNSHFFPTVATTDWSLTFWAKTSNVANSTVDVLRGGGVAVRNNTAGQLAFVVPGVASGSEETLWAYPAGGNDNTWHNYALTFASGQYRLYLDGALVDLKSGSASSSSPNLSIGARTPFPGWEGNLDELRIYHRRLDELDLQEVMTGTGSSITPNLKYYWKMDEGAGTKGFDILHRNRLFLCGAIWDLSRPPVHTSGVTNADGYYRIEGANYGTGTTFLASPSKNFYKHRALKFLKNESDYATLPDFGLTEKSTIELWVNQSEPGGDQALLSKYWSGGSQGATLRVSNGIVQMAINGSGQVDLGPLGIGYKHLALTINNTSTSNEVTLYINGAAVGSHSFPATTGDWSAVGERWTVGAAHAFGGPNGQFFGGLIDEFAVYDTTLSQTKILQHATTSRNPQEKHLLVYFPFDEGTGSKLTNSGSALMDGFGTTFGTEWTTFAPNQSTTPHVFAPGTRQVTLNPSVTSVDQVDFADRSTVAVSGFVRYAGTDCFANQVEILVNDKSFSPIILTDSTGKFTIDLEPGTSVTLKPKFKNHKFLPEMVDVTNVIAPLAGIVFNDTTTRRITGKVAGGFCKKSIIRNLGTQQATVCIVEVRTTNGCNIRTKVIDNTAGNYVFENLPPLDLTVRVIEHSDDDIKTAFEVQGGTQVDLTEKKDTVVNFTYFAPPVVELNGLYPFNPPSCPTIVLNQFEFKTINIKVKENYYNNEVCYLDTANIKLINGFEDSVKLLVLDTIIGLNYTFKVGAPVATPPFLKTLQVVATTATGNETQLTLQGLVTGIRNKHNTFTTQLPQVPTLVLHDPPGDGSFAYFEKGQKTCHSTEINLDYTTGGGGSLLLHLGAETHTILAPLGIGGEFDAEWENTISADANFAYKKLSANTFETCTSFSKRISTSDNQFVVGSEQGGDVYVGTGLNLEFGFADLVNFDTAACVGVVSSVLNVEPDQYQTNFIYSEWAVRENVMRYLDSLWHNPNTLPADTLKYKQSYLLWQSFLAENKHLRDTVTARENISFDAGVEYEYSTTSDTLKGSSLGEYFESEGGVKLNLGFKVIGLGIETELRFNYSLSKGEKNGDSKQTGLTTGYVLKDDDILDAFSVDVGIDPRYKTAIFRTKTGQSSCPWEPKTAHREGNSMLFRDGSGPVALDVPSNEPAVFLFTLGNNSETNETFTYYLGVGPESNAHGAKISVNGAPLDIPLLYAIPWEQRSLPITVTLERGPIEYNYDSLEVVFYSLCEDERATALGILPDDDHILYSAQYVSAHFIKPCSEVEIKVPEQGWVIYPGDTTTPNVNIRRITVSDYDLRNSDFELVRVQYRPAGGNGAWINIPGISERFNPHWSGWNAWKLAHPNVAADTLLADYTQYFWNTNGLFDGEYEIHAWAVCTGNVADKPGFSHIIRGRIERQPPSLIGVPQPMDGVYNVGDEISFEFNKDINCQKINALDNVLLFDATTDLPIDIDITCHANKIILDPNFQNEYFENRILRAELHDIEDLIGNNASNPILDQYNTFGWEFYVDRNELGWLTDSLGMTKFEDETKTATASIHNRGGYPVPFNFLDVPDWVHIVPNTGTLAPNEIRPIRFTVDSNLTLGHWTDSITLHTVTGQNPFFMGGNEGLPFGVRVVCRPPNWPFNSHQFENSMNMVVRLNIENVFSNDVEDMVVAFIGDTIVGRAHIEYSPQVGEWLAYLTIYGNPNHQLLPVRLEIWDASACLRYAVVEDFFTFQPDVVIGSAPAPQILHTNGGVLRDVPFGFGWNWLSFNLGFPDPSLDSVLVSLKYPENDLMRSQNAFAMYDASTGWLGSLANLGNTSMYIYRANQADTLKMRGTVLNPATTSIPVVQGWNWVGYIPNYPLPVNLALSSLNPQVGDLIKSQTAFAQYLDATFGWVGNLKNMAAPNGYQIKMSAPGTLIYPPKPNNKAAAGDVRFVNFLKVDKSVDAADERGDGPISSFWQVDPTQFEYSSTLIGALNINGLNATTASMELGAFAGNDVRGAGQAVFVSPTVGYVFFLTSYSNKSGEKLQFKLFDNATGQVQDLAETQVFTPDQHQGTLAVPVPFTLAVTVTGTAILQNRGTFEVQPNPFRGETEFRFTLPQAEEVTMTISNVGGQTVATRRISGFAGLNTLLWKGQTDAGERLAAGVYFARLATGAGSVVRKVVVE